MHPSCDRHAATGSDLCLQDLFYHIVGDLPLRMHCFTVTPVRGANQVVAMVKGYGAWTRGLISHIATHGEIRVAADGPYGAAEATHIIKPTALHSRECCL